MLLKFPSLIKTGQYSKTSAKFQKFFPEEAVIIIDGAERIEVSFAHKVFNKDNLLKEYWEDKMDIVLPPDREVWVGFNINKETLKL